MWAPEDFCRTLIRIDSDSMVLLTLSDVGEGQCTAIVRIVAEELEITASQVHLQPMLRKEECCLNFMLAVQAEFGSAESICGAWKPLREAAATARMMLVAAAAKRWDVDARSCHASEGEVIHTATWRKLNYGELAAEAARIPVPKNVALGRPGTSARVRA
jgi:isoquinoline 1-oxidoreductase beta subunit